MLGLRLNLGRDSVVGCGCRGCRGHDLQTLRHRLTFRFLPFGNAFVKTALVAFDGTKLETFLAAKLGTDLATMRVTDNAGYSDQQTYQNQSCHGDFSWG